MFRLSLVALTATLLAISSNALAAPCSDQNSIKRVRNTSIGAYEFVVFKYLRSPTVAVPDYAVTAGVPPFIADASGETVAVAGSHFTQVRFQGIFWTCTIKHQFTLPRTAIKDIKSIGQFEGVVTYAIGLRSQSHFVTTYSYPVGSDLTYVVLKFRK